MRRARHACEVMVGMGVDSILDSQCFLTSAQEWAKGAQECALVGAQESQLKRNGAQVLPASSPRGLGVAESGLALAESPLYKVTLALIVTKPSMQPSMQAHPPLFVLCSKRPELTWHAWPLAKAEDREGAV